MQTVPLGTTGLRVSRVGFGGIPIQGIPVEAAVALLHRALDRGITFFDTARAYTDSEEKMGRAFADRRHLIVLATKSLARDAAAMARDVETSLRNLRTDVIDLYQVHAVPSPADLERILAPGGAVEALDAARRDGRIRHLGLSTHSRDVALAAVRTGRFAAVQHPANYIEREWFDRVVPAARAGGVATIAMKPLAGGALDDAPAALRFVLHAGMDVAIPGLDAPEQVDLAAAAGVDLAPPSPEDLAALETSRRRWGDHFCRRCGYCKPCPEGLDIPFLFLIDGYYHRYELHDWALQRLGGLAKRFADCTGCGECLPRCPYGLPIPEMMRAAAASVLPR